MDCVNRWFYYAHSLKVRKPENQRSTYVFCDGHFFWLTSNLPKTRVSWRCAVYLFYFQWSIVYGLNINDEREVKKKIVYIFGILKQNLMRFSNWLWLLVYFSHLDVLVTAHRLTCSSNGIYAILSVQNVEHFDYDYFAYTQEFTHKIQYNINNNERLSNKFNLASVPQSKWISQLHIWSAKL